MRVGPLCLVCMVASVAHAQSGGQAQTSVAMFRQGCVEMNMDDAAVRQLAASHRWQTVPLTRGDGIAFSANGATLVLSRSDPGAGGQDLGSTRPSIIRTCNVIGPPPRGDWRAELEQLATVLKLADPTDLADIVPGVDEGKSWPDGSGGSLSYNLTQGGRMLVMSIGRAPD